MVTVYMDDVDAGGIVYHANYLKYAERARTEWLKYGGVSHAAIMSSGQGAIIVAELAIIYKNRAQLEDVLAVETQIANIRAASATLKQSIRRGSEIIAELTVEIVYINDKGRPVRWPDDIRQTMAARGPQ